MLPAAQGGALWFADALVTYKATGAETGGGLTVAEVRAPRGARSPRHRHHNEDEAWYVMEGDLTFWLGDEVAHGGCRRLRLRASGCRAPLSRGLRRGLLPDPPDARRVRGVHPRLRVARDGIFLSRRRSRGEPGAGFGAWAVSIAAAARGVLGFAYLFGVAICLLLACSSAPKGRPRTSGTEAPATASATPR